MQIFSLTFGKGVKINLSHLSRKWKLILGLLNYGVLGFKKPSESIGEEQEDYSLEKNKNTSK